MHHQQQLKNFRLYSIPYRLLLSSFTETASETASFRGTLRHISDGGHIDWDAFRRWLLGRGLSRRYVDETVAYAKRFSSFLGLKMGELLGVKGGKNALRALANLSKFLGCYGQFKMLFVNLGLKWDEGRSEDVFSRIYANELEGIDNWLENVRSVLDEDFWFAVRFMLETGLRTGEAIESLRLIREGKLRHYVNEELGILEHFRFGSVFFRKSKKVYVSVIRWETLERLASWKTKLTYPMLRKRLMKAGLPCRFYDLRKLNATFLATNGIEQPTIDILHGRCGSSIFAISYFRPEMGQTAERVRFVLEKEMKKRKM